jgi:hypothetical protein
MPQQTLLCVAARRVDVLDAVRSKRVAQPDTSRWPCSWHDKQ